VINIDLSVVAWGLAAVAVSAAAVRLILGVLAVQTARKLLTGTADRAHLLAVLRALLNSLKPPRR
jgi:hypothetical protein